MIKINKNKATIKIKKSNGFDRLDDSKIKKNDHLDHLDHLMNNDKQALRLHVDNLVLTYGIQAVRSIINSTDLSLIKKQKKVA